MAGESEPDLHSVRFDRVDFACGVAVPARGPCGHGAAGALGGAVWRRRDGLGAGVWGADFDCDESLRDRGLTGSAVESQPRCFNLKPSRASRTGRAPTGLPSTDLIGVISDTGHLHLRVSPHIQMGPMGK